MKTQQKKRAGGRPKKDSDQRQTESLDVRLTEAEKQAFKNAADVSGMAVSAWVRERLRRVAAKELQEVNQPVPFLAGHK